MGQRLRLFPGDSCPECGGQLIWHGRSVWTLFLRPSHLKCAGCRLIIRKRRSSTYRSSPERATGRTDDREIHS